MFFVSSFRKAAVINLLSFLFGWLKFVIFRKQITLRFRFLTPPIFSKQLVWDRKLRKIYSFEVNDDNEFATLSQIYGREDYNLSVLPQFRHIQSIYNEILENGKTPVILDLGGNVGFSSHYFSENFPESKIVYVEPSIENYRKAKLNVVGRNVDFIHGAIGSKSGKVSMVDPGLGNNGYRVETSRSGDVNMFSVPDILASLDQGKYQPFMIKIDIEGFERELFSSDTDWINLFGVLIIELHDIFFPGEANSANFLRAICGLNRDFVYMGENIFSVLNNHLSRGKKGDWYPQV